MSPPAWVELSRQTGDPRYAEFALKEFWAATDFLFDPVEKLYFRDSRFFERRDDQGRKLFWSRGNGWVFAGIANLLDSLPGTIHSVLAWNPCSRKWHRSSGASRNPTATGRHPC
jgi:rhamnogalacturonyl hydrolase YesR